MGNSSSGKTGEVLGAYAYGLYQRPFPPPPLRLHAPGSYVSTRERQANVVIRLIQCPLNFGHLPQRNFIQHRAPACVPAGLRLAAPASPPAFNPGQLPPTATALRAALSHLFHSGSCLSGSPRVTVGDLCRGAFPRSPPTPLQCHAAAGGRVHGGRRRAGMEGQDATGPVGNGGSGEAAVVAGVPAADPAALIRAVLPPGALNSPPTMLPDDDLDEDPTGNLDGLVGGADVGGGVVASLGGAMDGPEAEAEEDGAEGPPPGASALPPRGLSVQEIDNIHKLAANFRSLGLDPESLAHAPYRRVLLSGESSLPPTGEAAAAAAMLRGAIGLREKWLYRREVEEWDTPARPAPPRPSPYTTFVPPPYDPFDEPLPAASSAVCHWEDGVLVVYASPAALMRRTPIYPHRRWREFADDLRTLMSVVVAPAARSFCHLRLKLLAERFAMHATLNERQERLEQAAVPHRDFYNVRKVDTHVHHSSSMNQKHLLRFIKSKVRRCGDDKVLIDRSDPSGERVLTLTEVFTSLNLTTHELSVDTLDMHADNTTFHRFDRFNLKYVPAGEWPGGAGTCGLRERRGGGGKYRHGVGGQRRGRWLRVGSAVGLFFGLEPSRPCGHSDAHVSIASGYKGVGCELVTHCRRDAFFWRAIQLSKSCTTSCEDHRAWLSGSVLTLLLSALRASGCSSPFVAVRLRHRRYFSRHRQVLPCRPEPTA